LMDVRFSNRCFACCLPGPGEVPGADILDECTNCIIAAGMDIPKFGSERMGITFRERVRRVECVRRRFRISRLKWPA